MYAAFLCTCVLITPSDVNFAWATVQPQPCKCDVVAFAWSQVAASEDDICKCGKQCPCCQIAGGCKCKEKECLKLTQTQIYNQMRSQAVKDGKPLLVFVKCQPRKVEGTLSCRWDGFPIDTDGIVVGLPNGSDLIQGSTLSSGASDAAIKQAAKPKALTPSGPIRQSAVTNPPT